MNPLLPFEWVLATRFLREGLLQTLFIIAGVALGVSVIVFMSALLTGLRGSIFKTLLDFQAQIVIKSPDEAPRSLRQEPGVELPPGCSRAPSDRARSTSGRRYATPHSPFPACWWWRR